MRNSFACPHFDPHPEADTGKAEIPLRVLTPEGAELDGIVVRVVFGLCQVCDQRVVTVTAHPTGEPTPTWVSLPAVLELDPGSYGLTGGWSL